MNAGDSLVVIDRPWVSGDVVELQLPMQLRSSTWHENAVAVERGPLVYALRIGASARRVKDTTGYGEFEEIRPTTPWNYGLIDVGQAELQKDFIVEVRGPENRGAEVGASVSAYPWTVSAAPVVIHAKGRRLPQWGLYNESAGPQPYSNIYQPDVAPGEEDIVLVPYGCTRLRISEFPVVGK